MQSFETHPTTASHRFSPGAALPPLFENASPRPVNDVKVHRKADCACGGSCPSCQAKSSLNVSQPNDPAEIEADQIAEKVMRMPVGQETPTVSATHRNSAVYRKCADCERDEEIVQRMAVRASPNSFAQTTPNVQSVVSSGGTALDEPSRRFFEPRLGLDLSAVRIHIGGDADRSARSLDARAYTVGNNVVFGHGEYQPASESGRLLLAHELAHVAQGSKLVAEKIHRTPASKVSCANRTPLVIASTGTTIADPVAVITAAENRANEMFDDAIGALDSARQRILNGAPTGWPTMSDALATGLQLMGLNPEDRAIWTAPNGTGRQSVPLLLRRLRAIRRTIGAGSFFFFCDGTGMRTIGGCAAPPGVADICVGAVLTTCVGEFLTAMCPDFWDLSAENQAARIVHESAHNFGAFIGHTGRFTNAECFARLIQVFAGVDVADQRVDLCPDP